MEKDIYQLQKENTISKVLLGEDRIKKEKKKLNNIALLILILIIIDFLLFKVCNLITDSLALIILSILMLLFMGLLKLMTIMDMKFLKDKIENYKPTRIQVLFYQIDWDDYYLNHFWYSEIKNKFDSIPTKKIKLQKKSLKYSIDKPTLNYANLIAVISVILSLIFGMTKDLRGETYLLITILFLAYLILIIYPVVGLINDRYTKNLDGYKTNIRWCKFYEHLLLYRKEQEKVINEEKPVTLICKLLKIFFEK